MSSVFEICTPRKDVLSGDISDDMYAAHLGLVARGKAMDVYQKPATFFKYTYPTAGLQSVVKDVFTRLAGAGAGAGVIKLETSLGGGKTHTLIALYHLAKNGSKTPGAEGLVGNLKFGPVRIATVIGTQMGLAKGATGSRTLWGVIARELFGESGYSKIRPYDEQLMTPGEDAILDLIGGEKCLILIDELALYLAKAAAVTVGDSTLAKQTIAFLQELTQVAGANPNIVVVITTLDKNVVFSEETEELRDILDTDLKRDRAKQAVEDADRILSRLVQNRTPTKGEEFAAVVRHRLFEKIDETAAKSLCQEYVQAYHDSSNADYLPSSAKDPKYLSTMIESYPFHPELINILRTKTSSIINFNKTRGVLRLLSKVVRNVWASKEKTGMIHPYHIDFSRQEFVEELVQRLDKGEYLAALAADIANEREPARASKVDENFSEPLGSRICTTIFLHSITGAAAGTDIMHGAKEPEIYISLCYPGLDLKKAEDALKLVEDTCFYVVRQGATYAFNTEPNLNKLIEGAKDSVEKTRVQSELEDRIRALYSSRQYFSPILYANEPSKVPDDTEKPKLVILHYRDCSIKSKSTKVPPDVRQIFETKGTQKTPRLYANNLVFLVADADQIDRMNLKGTEFLALKSLTEDLDQGASYLSGITMGQRDRLKKLRQEAELYLKIAVVVCYRHLVVSSAQATLEEPQHRRPLRILTMRVTDSEAKSAIETHKSQEQAIVEFLRDQGVARTLDDKPLAPEFMIEQVWDKQRDSVSADEFRDMFYRSPDCGLVLSEALIEKTLRQGLQEGDWIAVHGGNLYDRTNHAQFSGGFVPEVTVVLSDTKTAKDLLKDFYCQKCGKRKSECQCQRVCENCGRPVESCTCPKEERCPVCGRPVAECNCGETDGTLQVEEMKLERAAGDAQKPGELQAKLEEKKVEQVDSVHFKAHTRNALIKLGRAVPQFGKVELRFRVHAVMNQRASGGNLLEFRYEGDAKGYNAIASIVQNYEAKSEFSSYDLFVDVKFPEGIPSKQFVELLRGISRFTDEELFTVTVKPVPKEGKR